jgi:hypothetical protein
MEITMKAIEDVPLQLNTSASPARPGIDLDRAYSIFILAYMRRSLADLNGRPMPQMEPEEEPHGEA